MTIGIMTFWWSQDNYGQLLQCYALQKYLRDAGYDVFLIRYRFDIDNKPFTVMEKITRFLKKSKKIIKIVNPKYVYKYLCKNEKSKKTEQDKQPFFVDRQFDYFRNKYILQSEKFYTSYFELKRNPPKADIYIVGSDQVWHFNNKNKNFLHAYLLDFGDKNIIRMSYAASWSLKNLQDGLLKQIHPLLKKFSYVSVREKNGLDLCKQCGFDGAEYTCDPTFLLNAKIYRNIYANEIIKKQEGKYILLYMLNNENNFNIQNVYTFAKKKKLKVIFVTANGEIYSDLKKEYPTIPEWLYLIDNAEYVITNSFHCCVFCSIFNKKFGVIKLSGILEGLNTRIESLFDLLEIEDRYIDMDFSILEKEYRCETNFKSNILNKINEYNQK